MRSYEASCAALSTSGLDFPYMRILIIRELHSSRVISYQSCSVHIQLVEVVQKCHYMPEQHLKLCLRNNGGCTTVTDVRNLILHYSLAYFSLFI
jgi:hypothetical protein